MTHFFEEYWAILSDPAHLAVEVTLMFLLDVLILGLLWPLVRRAISREHRKIDVEHGFEHPEDYVPYRDWRLNLQPPLPDGTPYEEQDKPAPYTLTDKGWNA